MDEAGKGNLHEFSRILIKPAIYERGLLKKQLIQKTVLAEKKVYINYLVTFSLNSHCLRPRRNIMGKQNLHIS